MRRLLTLPLVLLAAGCGAAGAETSGMYAGLNEYEATGAVKQILSDESTRAGSPVRGKAMLVGSATRSRYTDNEADAWRVDEADAWRVEVLTLEERPSGLCVWVAARGADPLNYDYVYELDRCEIGVEDAGA